MAHVTLVIGGARSGKSSYASALALAACPRPVYVATARLFDGDAEFAQRIALHRQDRAERFELVEAERALSAHADTFRGKAVVVDCMTLWLTNYFLDADCDGVKALEAAKADYDALIEQWDTTLILVTNEIGSGVHAETTMGRAFVDAQGWLNQHISRSAARVVLMVAGQPLQVKPPPGGAAAAGAAAAASVAAHLARETADRVLSTRGIAMDPDGYFIVRALAAEQLLVLEFYSSKTDADGNVVDPLTGETIACHAVRTPTRVLRARTAKAMQVQLLESPEHEGLVGSLAHACYLGRELQRAEAALATGTAYQAD
jgi:adenosylcobinamide kinase/adenosylcobinamide-phosphate guanylyltransferase